MSNKTTMRLIRWILAVILLVTLLGAGYRQWTPVQESVHEAAECLRSLGYTDDSPAIQALQEKWHSEESKMVTIPEITLEPAVEIATPELTPWEEFNLIHPGYSFTEADFWTCCQMLTVELGNAERNGQYDMGTAILIARIPVNRCLYCDEFPDTITGCVMQRNQYNPAYYTTTDQGYPEHVKEAVAYAMLMDTTIPAELSLTGSDMEVPHSLFYHGNYLTGGYEWLRVSVRTSGGYSATLVFGYDPTRCTG